MKANGRVAIRKMYKLYINGAFARSESARSDRIGGENVARASRKDVRDAVVAARAGLAAWSSQAPATRGLVLYRLAEMMEARAAELAAQLLDVGQKRLGVVGGGARRHDKTLRWSELGTLRLYPRGSRFIAPRKPRPRSEVWTDGP